jgi:hypothetical protein
MGAADSKYINLAEGLPRTANNEGLYKKLAAKFEASVDLDAFDAAVSGGDWERAGEIVHAAKGVAGNLALAAFYDDSIVLMDELRGGNAPQQENIDAFRESYKETIRAINTYLE